MASKQQHTSDGEIWENEVHRLCVLTETEIDLLVQILGPYVEGILVQRGCGTVVLESAMEKLQAAKHHKNYYTEFMPNDVFIDEPLGPEKGLLYVIQASDFQRDELSEITGMQAFVAATDRHPET